MSVNLPRRFVILLASTQLLLPAPSGAFSAAAASDTGRTCGSDNNGSTPAGAERKLDDLKFDTDRLREAVASGRVYQQRDFLTERQVRAMLSEVDDLRASGTMQPSGLSNTNKGTDQNFGKADREVCPVPWWKESLSEEVRREAGGEDLSPEEVERSAVRAKLRDLRSSLSSLLDRPTMSDSELAHECYYSRSTKGASLDRHMDERHEETKGSRGWLLPSRRSISWLVYLSDPNWDADANGGQLRSFPQANVDGCVPGKLETGSHDGNLQVGWLLRWREEAMTVPVYLDSWFKMRNANTGDDEPHCILYVVDNEAKDDGVEYITRPWLSDIIQGGTAADFLKARAKLDEQVSQESGGCGLFVNTQFASAFRLVEDRESWSTGKYPDGSVADDIIPLRGSLIMFDSVSVPHEVLVVKAGTRTALAGWFHEETQSFPDDFYES